MVLGLALASLTFVSCGKTSPVAPSATAQSTTVLSEQTPPDVPAVPDEAQRYSTSSLGTCYDPWGPSPLWFDAAGGTATLTNFCANAPAFLSPQLVGWIHLPGFVYGSHVKTVKLVVDPNPYRVAREALIYTGGLLTNAKPAAVRIYQAGRR